MSSSQQRHGRCPPLRDSAHKPSSWLCCPSGVSPQPHSLPAGDTTTITATVSAAAAGEEGSRGNGGASTEKGRTARFGSAGGKAGNCRLRWPERGETQTSAWNGHQIQPPELRYLGCLMLNVLSLQV